MADYDSDDNEIFVELSDDDEPENFDALFEYVPDDTFEMQEREKAERRDRYAPWRVLRRAMINDGFDVSVSVTPPQEETASNTFGSQVLAAFSVTIPDLKDENYRTRKDIPMSLTHTGCAAHDILASEMRNVSFVGEERSLHYSGSELPHAIPISYLMPKVDGYGMQLFHLAYARNPNQSMAHGRWITYGIATVAPESHVLVRFACDETIISCEYVPRLGYDLVDGRGTCYVKTLPLEDVSGLQVRLRGFEATHNMSHHPKIAMLHPRSGHGGVERVDVPIWRGDQLPELLESMARGFEFPCDGVIAVARNQQLRFKIYSTSDLCYTGVHIGAEGLERITPSILFAANAKHAGILEPTENFGIGPGIVECIAAQDLFQSEIFAKDLPESYIALKQRRDKMRPDTESKILVARSCADLFTLASHYHGLVLLERDFQTVPQKCVAPFVSGRAVDAYAPNPPVDGVDIHLQDVQRTLFESDGCGCCLDSDLIDPEFGGDCACNDAVIDSYRRTAKKIAALYDRDMPRDRIDERGPSSIMDWTYYDDVVHQLQYEPTAEGPVWDSKLLPTIDRMKHGWTLYGGSIPFEPALSISGREHMLTCSALGPPPQERFTEIMFRSVERIWLSLLVDHDISRSDKVLYFASILRANGVAFNWLGLARFLRSLGNPYGRMGFRVPWAQLDPRIPKIVLPHSDVLFARRNLLGLVNDIRFRFLESHGVIEPTSQVACTVIERGSEGEPLRLAEINYGYFLPHHPRFDASDYVFYPNVTRGRLLGESDGYFSVWFPPNMIPRSLRGMYDVSRFVPPCPPRKHAFSHWKGEVLNPDG